MSKSELRSALESLQVKRPLRLQSRAPTFVPPVENMTPVNNSAPVENSTLVENPTQAENQTLVPNPTLVTKSTQVEKTTQVYKASEQSSAVALESRASEGLEKGYTRLPNSILMKMANGDLTRGEMKVLLLIARFTISFQRRLAPLSKAVLERQSGLRGAAVLDAISGLLEKNLVLKEKGDQHRPNQLGLVLPPEWDQWTQVENMTQVTKPTRVENATHTLVPKATYPLVGNPTYFKDIKNNKNSLSEKNRIESEPLRGYFENLKPLAKQDSEQAAFEGLLQDFSELEIETAFCWLMKHGTLGEKIQPHSPMKYLAVTMIEVLEFARKTHEQERARAERAEQVAFLRANDEAQIDREAEELRAIEARFMSELPDHEKRREFIQSVAKNIPMLDPEGPVVRAMALRKWDSK